MHNKRKPKNGLTHIKVLKLQFNTQLTKLLLLLQEIKRDNQKVASRKRALYQEFLKCGVKTWETVISALEKSDEANIAEQVKQKINGQKK